MDPILLIQVIAAEASIMLYMASFFGYGWDDGGRFIIAAFMCSVLASIPTALRDRRFFLELGSIQREGVDVETRLGQVSLFGEERNPVVDALVRALDGKPNAVREAFDKYSRDADENMPGQPRMFGEANAFDAFNHAFGSTLSEQEFRDGLNEIRDGESRSEPVRPDAQADGDLSEVSPAREGSGGKESGRAAGPPVGCAAFCYPLS